jgi:hypothetical protein
MSLLEETKDTAHQRASEMEGLHSDASSLADETGDPKVRALADRIRALAETMWDEVRKMEALLGMAPEPRPTAKPRGGMDAAGHDHALVRDAEPEADMKPAD